MSEYLNKKAVLEWLKEQQKQQEENRDRLEIDHPYWEYHEGASDYLSLAVEKFESGAFDADESEGTWKATAEVLGRENAQMNSEVQRLRAALVEIKQLLNENRENDGAFQSWNHMQAWKVATQALSTTSEPCPTCGINVESACPIGDCEPTSAERVREPVMWFAEQMEAKLRENEHKGGWENESLSWLYTRMIEEAEEVKEEIKAAFEREVDYNKIIREAADVANFAMMIAGNARRMMEGDGNDA